MLRSSPSDLHLSKVPLKDSVISVQKSQKVTTNTTINLPRRRLIAVSAAALVLVSSSIFLSMESQDSGRQVSSQLTQPETVVSEGSEKGFTSIPISDQSNWEVLARSVVLIKATGPGCGRQGSGSIVLDGSYVLTNQHVVGDGDCSLQVGLTDSTDSEPRKFIAAQIVISDALIDLAVIRLLDSNGAPFTSSEHKPLEIDYSALRLGDKVFTLGYPGAGGSTATLTSGDYSGLDSSETDFYKTTANMNPGVSGGSAFSAAGKLIGVPTAGVIDPQTKQSVGLNLIRPIRFAREILERATEARIPFLASDPGSSSDLGSAEESSADPVFGTCQEAKRYGYGPYYQDSDYEYDYYDDRDNDGVVCE